MAVFDQLLPAEGLTPHGVCLLWDPGLVWLHAAADGAIGLAYLAIPAALAMVGRRRPDLNPYGVLYWFAAFIILCAVTHLLGIVTLWAPWYLLSGVVKVGCAAVSVVTAALVWRILGFVLSVPSHAEMRAANTELRRLNEVLEERVDDRTRELSAANERLVVAVYEAREADRTKADFLARMSHELRTPLNAIIGFCEMLTAGIGGALRDRQREYCGNIHAAAIQLLDQINDILDLERLGRGADAPTPGRVDLAEICRDAVGRLRVVAVEAGISVNLDIPAGLTAWADGRALLTILVNLVSNAVKYSPRDGDVQIRCEPAGGGVTIRVADHGYGVGEGQVARVFEPFYRAHERELPAVGGSGLGLSLVKMLVEAHGGHLHFDSRVDEGTTVTVWLPGEDSGRLGPLSGVVERSETGGFATGPILSQP